MKYIQVDHTRDVYITRESDPNDEWDRDCTGADITIHGLILGTDQHYRDIVVPFDIDPSKTYFLLWADYGTGDSFGNDDNCAEFIDLFESLDKAIAARTKLFKVEDSYNVEYEREDGSKVLYHPPWYGYFEHLNSLNVEVVRVTKIR